MLIDTHCHLTDPKFEGKVEEILAEAKRAGVERILVPTVGLVDARKAIALAGEYEGVWALAGIHPETLEDETRAENRAEWLAAGGEWGRKLEELILSSKRVVGIGEIGLDFHYDREKASKKIQMELLREQLELANKLELPVVIHMRDAEEEMVEVLRGLGEIPQGQFHCWSGSEAFLTFVLEKGFYISFGGNITYKSAQGLRELIKVVPTDKLLLETDSPYLAPEGKRNGLNIPANVKIIADFIATLLGVQTETLINQTSKNALCLFFGGG